MSSGRGRPTSRTENRNYNREERDRRGDRYRENSGSREKNSKPFLSETKRERSPLNKPVTSRNVKQDEVGDSARKKCASRCRLFVGSLSNEVKESDLREIFEKYGEVVECFMSGKGFGFVRLDTRARAELAKENLDGFMLKGRAIRVRYAVHGASVKVKELSPYVSNELLSEAFAMFGDVERAVHILDEKSQPTGEGIVEFERKPGAVDALRRINEGIFLLTTNPRPVFVEPLDPRDDEDGLSERMLPKNNQYQRERNQPPRFAVPGSFEFEFGNRWKELYQLERAKRDQLERELKEARERLDNEMELAYQEYQAAQLREDLKRRQEELERLEASKRERLEMLRMREEERSRDRERERERDRSRQDVMVNSQHPPFNRSLQQAAAFHGQANFQPRLGGVNANDSFRPSIKTEDQLVHGVQKLMQMMQQNNRGGAALNSAGFQALGVPTPNDLHQQMGGSGTRPNNLAAEFFTGMPFVGARFDFAGGDSGRGGRVMNRNR